MKRGEVWDIASPDGAVHRVLILSEASWNTSGPAQCVPLLRAHGVPEILPFIVLTHPTDPVTGAIDMTALGPVDPADGVEPVATMGGATMARTGDALRLIFGLID